jgi:hypothetical protein
MPMGLCKYVHHIENGIINTSDHAHYCFVFSDHNNMCHSPTGLLLLECREL